MSKLIWVLCFALLLVSMSALSDAIAGHRATVVAKQDAGCCRTVARVTGNNVTSMVIRDHHRMSSSKLVAGSLVASGDCDCDRTVHFEFASPTDCDSGRVVKSRKGRVTYEFDNGDHVHLKAVKNKKTGEVEVKVDHDD